MAAKPWQFQPSGSINIPLGATVASATVPDGFYLMGLTANAQVGLNANLSSSGGALSAGNLGPFYIGVPIQGWPPMQVNGNPGRSGSFQVTIYAQASGSSIGTLSLIPCPPCP
ncbi:MAG: hypothetical protein ACYDHY_07740 [Acidiferrobacterales bacterium]